MRVEALGGLERRRWSHDERRGSLITFVKDHVGRGFAWLDTGTFESLIDAASFVQTLETRQGMKVACLEEIAFRLGFINRDQLLILAKSLEKSGYGKYLTDLIEPV
jgi:glucose-1-phosphate thymidylyltransferase